MCCHFSPIKLLFVIKCHCVWIINAHHLTYFWCCTDRTNKEQTIKLAVEHRLSTLSRKKNTHTQSYNNWKMWQYVFNQWRKKKNLTGKWYVRLVDVNEWVHLLMRTQAKQSTHYSIANIFFSFGVCFRKYIVENHSKWIVGLGKTRKKIILHVKCTYYKKILANGRK